MSLTRYVPVSWDVDVLGAEGRLQPVARPAFFTSMDASMDRMYNEMKQAALVGPDVWRLRENATMDNPIVVDKDGHRKYRLQFDVHHFKPEEISIKTVGNELSVSARQEEKTNDRAVSREYNRKYTLPTDLQASNLTSRLAPDGILTIEAPLPPVEVSRQETVIPIQHLTK